MTIRITCTHKLGFTYQLVTNTKNWTQEQAVAQARKTAEHHFGLLPAPTDFEVKVEEA